MTTLSSPLLRIPTRSRTRVTLAWAILAFTVATLSARDLYVSALEGDDARDGTSPARALATLKKAAELVQPGDTVLIGDGVYTDNDRAGHSAIVTTRVNGRPDAWITWKARPGHRPELHPLGWNGIVIASSYQIVDGLTVVGSNDSITLKEAIEDTAKPRANTSFNTNGIGVNGSQNAPDNKPHHVIIRNCVVTKCGGGGIFAMEADYVTIEDCQTFENGWYARYANSGISVIDNWAHDDAPGYHYIIQRNLSWNNRSLVPWLRTGKLSDGNGIILDVADQKVNGATNPDGDAIVQPATSTPAPPRRPIWKGRTLVANNLSAFNGGSGIHTFRTSHVDIVNNTTYWNGSVVGYEELFSNQSNDVVILNNVIVPRPRGKVTSNHGNKGLRWDYNVYPGTSLVTGPNDLVAAPQFVSIRPDLREADFRLRKGSPARDRGTRELLQLFDLAGKKRPANQAPDLGALEH